MNKKILIFNWKMNPVTLAEASILAQASDHENVVVAPPFPFLESVSGALIKAKLGAQDLFWEEKGAFTGEVSAQELKSIGVSYVIIGHSERRHKLGETDEIIAKKMKAALGSGLIPVLCVGETKAEKDSGIRESVIERQLESGLCLINREIHDDVKNSGKFLIAYEPVWAIGTGDPETPAGAVKAIDYIKSLISNRCGLKVGVLYGGSVDSKNLKDFLSLKEIDGALVGGASLKKEEVEKMIEIV